MLAIAINALYTTLSRRGTTRQLAGAIVLCVVSALLLLLAITWYELRFTTERSALTMAEIQVALSYVALFGWVLPMSVTSSYCLLALPRTSTTSMQLQVPKQKRNTKLNTTTALLPPRHQPGVIAPLVYSEDTPWGWLEHRGGRFQGQRLRLIRAIVTLGRDEENDIWLDDEQASRHHAELTWDKGQIYITDCDSLNGVLVNGQRIRGSVLVAPNDFLEIGTHRFIFILAEHQPSDLSDPLAHHKWHSSLESLTGRNDAYKDDGLAPTRPLLEGRISASTTNPPVVTPDEIMLRDWHETAQIAQVTPPPQPNTASGAMRIHDGAQSGHFFLLDRPVVSVGRGIESDILIDDESISRIHAQFLRQLNGNYVQDLASRNGTKVNGALLTGPRQLTVGDIICVGNITLEYISIEAVRTIPLSLMIIPRPFSRSMSGPMPLRLPSRKI